MPDISRIKPTSRRDLHVFYVLDTSGSMEGKPIQILNQTMQETIKALEKVAKSNGDAQLKISVLEFASVAKWMQPSGPEKVEDFVWMDLTAGGLTQVGAALKELNSKLDKNEFLQTSNGMFLPVIIFMTDGHPTDEYEPVLEEIKKNKLFRRATKIGFAVGEHADVEMIAHLTGDSEAVIRTNNLAVFAKLLQFVSVTSSVLASTPKTGPISTGRDAVWGALEESGINPEDVSSGIDYIDPDTVILNNPMNTSSVEIAWEDSDDEDW